MGLFLLKRVLTLIATLVGASVVVFLALEILPGNAAQATQQLLSSEITRQFHAASRMRSSVMCSRILPGFTVASAKWQLTASLTIAQPHSHERPLPRARVLVVEDNPVNQLVAAEMLKRLGLHADVAGNGAEALEVLDRLPYDLILMDCQMPVMDGFEATRRLRKTDGPRLPVIAMTANAIRGDRERCLDAGMDDYLPKPVRISELKAMMRRWLPASGVEPA